MKTTIAAASLVALLMASPALAAQTPRGQTIPAEVQFAQAATSTPRADQWLYDAHGNRMGSIRSINHEAGTADIMIGAYFEPGSHAETVPLSSLTMSGSRVVLLTGTARG